VTQWRDTGADCKTMLQRMRGNWREVGPATHAHRTTWLIYVGSEGDGRLSTFQARSGRGAEAIAEGKRFRVGSPKRGAINLRPLLGGMTYVVTGLSVRLRSWATPFLPGRWAAGTFLRDAAKQSRKTDAADETIICPHGPLTTVGKEKRDNPFFAMHWR
jgi:hypothetical protein